MPRLALAALAVLAACGKDAPVPDPDERSAFFESVDVNALGSAYGARFTSVSSAGARTGMRVTPPGHWIADFRVEGEIDRDEVARLADELVWRLREQAQESGAQVSAPPRRLVGSPHLVDARPLNAALTFTYDQGSNLGACDVSVQQKGSAFSLVVTVREPR